ncbi:FtsX-like permease family protein [Eubacterium multiforme]|uniref:ABC transport system permease protein n=1 Tax=Eubacterium multiforme TaxID=83339 RepID=A0ABT9UXL9_9FIRM|nr:ABC transporter permease [Eubacterium multiforme]MDQ0151063.1 putative ABC transport system permease protein [Eubacterium multiforme]
MSKFFKNKGFTGYLFLNLFLVLVTLIFVVSMGMDIFLKVNSNKKVMNLNNYICVKNEDNLNNNMPYYKSTILSDSESGKEYNVIFISPEFLNLKEFKIKDSKNPISKMDKKDVLVGKNLNLKEGENLKIKGFTTDVNVSVKGILEDEYLWIKNDVVPSSLDNNIVILDRKTDMESSPRIFKGESEKNTDKNFIPIYKHILKNIFNKSGEIYVSLIFFVVLMIIAINSMSIILRLIINKRKKEFGIKYSLGATPKDVLKEIASEIFFILIGVIVFAILVSSIIQKIIPSKLGYTFNLWSLVISICIYIVMISIALYKIKKDIINITISYVIKRSN